MKGRGTERGMLGKVPEPPSSHHGIAPWKRTCDRYTTVTRPLHCRHTAVTRPLHDRYSWLDRALEAHMRIHEHSRYTSTMTVMCPLHDRYLRVDENNRPPQPLAVDGAQADRKEGPLAVGEPWEE